MVFSQTGGYTSASLVIIIILIITITSIIMINFLLFLLCSDLLNQKGQLFGSKDGSGLNLALSSPLTHPCIWQSPL